MSFHTHSFLLGELNFIGLALCEPLYVGMCTICMCIHEEARGQCWASSLAILHIHSLYWLLFLCVLIHQNVLILKEILYSSISMHLDPLVTPNPSSSNL